MTVKLFRGMTLYTPRDRGHAPRGAELNEVERVAGAALLCRDGLVERVGAECDVLDGLAFHTVNQEIDFGGRAVIPGFVDAHTHMCFAARREAEFSMRVAGKPYLEILAAGGGILNSARVLRGTDEDALFETTLKNAARALRSGTTTVEIKSGYGLTLESELKMLRVISRIGRATRQDVVATFMGAHALPEEYASNPQAYVDLIVNEMLPAVRRQGIATFCDIFCEKGVFSVEQSREILTAAEKLGFLLKIHADEVTDTGGAALAGDLGTVSAEHLLAASDDGLAAMARAGVIAALLPATAFSLRHDYARARRMIELGLPIAITTDCNPGSCFCDSMPFVFALSVLGMRLSVEEALTAATLGGAYAIRAQEYAGSIEKGKNADFLVLDGDSPAVLAYHLGANPVERVFKRGEDVVF